jgi:hypothetical protein
MQGPTQKCKKGRSQGIRREFGDSASQKQTGLPSPLGPVASEEFRRGQVATGHEGGCKRKFTRVC